MLLCLNKILFSFLFVVICFQQISAQITTFDPDKYFMSYPLKANWFKAYKFCANMDQNLVTADTPEKIDEINRFIGSLNINNRFNIWQENILVAGTDNGFEGNFYWMTTGKDFNNQLWNEMEPNGGTNENCVTIWNIAETGYKFRWNDAPCDVEYYFICENRNSYSIDVRASL